MTRGCIRGFFLGGWGFCPGWFCRGVLSGVLTGVILSGVLSAVVLSGFCPGGVLTSCLFSRTHTQEKHPLL